jgi:hypothetical protein
MRLRYVPTTALIGLVALLSQALTSQVPAQSPAADPPPMKAEDTPQTTPQAPPTERPQREMQQRTGPEQPVPPGQQGAQQPSAQQGAQQQGAPQQQNAQPGTGPQAPASAQQQQPPAGAPLGSAQQQRDGHEATQTRSGIGGKQEPSASTPAVAQDTVLVDGKWNVPGAPVDSQTVPAKFSQGNAALDKRPIMAFPLALSEEQRQKLVAAIRQSDVKDAQIDPKLTEELPVTVQLHEMPLSANEMGVGNYKYVRTSDRILLVNPSNRIVVGEING